MNNWQRVIVVALIGAFPLALVQLLNSHNVGPETGPQKAYSTNSPKGNASKQLDTQMASQNKNMIPNSKTQLDAAKTDVGVERGAFIQLERTIDAKVEEMKQIDATILETSEEIARLEEQKAKARNDLIGLQSKVANMIDEIRSDDLTAR